MAQRGSPTSFTQKVADTICERIADGESLRSICDSDDMPSKTSVMRWLLADDTFRDQYTRAREVQADTLFDDILDIADDARNDWMMRRGEEDAGWQANGEHIQRSKLRLDARKWMASKLQPKKYGEKLELAGDPSAPLIPVLNVTIGKPGLVPASQAGGSPTKPGK